MQQVLARGLGRVRFASGFRHHEGSLEYRLNVTGERRCRHPACARLSQGCGEIGLKRGSVTQDTGIAGFADRIAGPKHFLHHRPGDTAEGFSGAADQRNPQIDIAQDPLGWIGKVVVGSSGEECAGLA